MSNSLPYKIEYEISTEAQELSKRLGVSWLLDQETPFDPFYRLRAVIQDNVEIQPQETVPVSTGIYLQNVNPYIQAEILSFSSLTYEKNLIVLDSPAIYNWSHRNQIVILLHNVSNKVEYIFPSQIIACLRFTTIPLVFFNRVYQVEEAPYSFDCQGWIQKLKQKKKEDRPSEEYSREDIEKYLNDR